MVARVDCLSEALGGSAMAFVPRLETHRRARLTQSLSPIAKRSRPQRLGSSSPRVGRAAGRSPAAAEQAGTFNKSPRSPRGARSIGPFQSSKDRRCLDEQPLHRQRQRREKLDSRILRQIIHLPFDWLSHLRRRDGDDIPFKPLRGFRWPACLSPPVSKGRGCGFDEGLDVSRWVPWRGILHESYCWLGKLSEEGFLLAASFSRVIRERGAEENRREKKKRSHEQHSQRFRRDSKVRPRRGF
jgi:hypothetical protein